VFCIGYYLDDKFTNSRRRKTYNTHDKVKNANKIPVNPNGKANFEELHLVREDSINTNLKKYNAKIWAVSFWLRSRVSGRLT
jgi:hypothetical protein